MSTGKPLLGASAPAMDGAARRRFDCIARHLVIDLPRQRHPQHTQYCFASSLKAEYGGSSSPVVIGGMVLDIHAKPYTQNIPGTTTPGKVQYIDGGVARNIFECLQKLGGIPFLISVLGCDMAGDLLLTFWKSTGMSMKGILRSSDISTPVVLNIFDHCGELAAAVASVEAVEAFLTPEWIKQFEHKISSAPFLVVDANLHPSSLEISCQIAAEYDIPVWFEPVSVTKSTRIASIATYITCCSPNENELIAIANALSTEKKFSLIDCNREGTPVQTLFQMLNPAIIFLLEKGIKMLIVTLGSDGAFLCFKEAPVFWKGTFVKKNGNNFFSREMYDLINERCPSVHGINLRKSNYSYCHYSSFHFPTLSASVVSLTGAGDCLVGGVLAAICSGLDIMQSMAVGISVAKAAVEAELNVPTKFNMISVADDAEKIYRAAKAVVA